MKTLQKLLEQSTSFAIVTHKRPDGDAISSSLAMFWYLVSLNKDKNDIDVIIPNYSSDFDFIPGISYLSKSSKHNHYDVVICVDCADIDLLSTVDVLSLSQNIICFDHHENTSIDGTMMFLDSTASSCTCIIQKILSCSDKNFLTCIAIGLLSDTVNLKTNVTEQARNIIENLSMLLDIDSLKKQLISSSIRTKELAKIVLERGYYLNNTIFCSTLFQSDFLPDEKSLETINHKKIIQNLEELGCNYDYLIFLIENNDGCFKGSLRGNGVDLNKICQILVDKKILLKGGGHPHSSGFTATGSPDKIIKNIALTII